MNIYLIEQNFLAIEQELEENGGEMTPELEEKFNLTQESFKEKTKSCGEFIRHLNAEVDEIDKEIARLKALKDSKTRTINSITKLLVGAIDKFGDSTPKGTKFVDYGTGKISIKTTQSVDVNEDIVERTATRANSFITWCKMNKVDVTSVDKKELIEYINKVTDIESMEGLEEVPQITEQDLSTINIQFTYKTTLDKLFSKDGNEYIPQTTIYDIKSTASKSDIKSMATGEQHYIPVFAELKTNKNITIK